jgi:serine phosphatase RsbU (regulator of sigma subunit)
MDLGSRPSTLLLYTDGVPDAESEGGERFEESRLVDVLKVSGSKTTGDLVSRVRTSIKQFTRNHPQTDDITILALRLE